MNALLLQCCGCTAKIVKCDCDLLAATSWQNVTIVFFICAAIVVIATYGTCRFFTNKAKEREFQKGRESQKHNWDIEDEERKQKADLLDKLIVFLKSQTEEKDIEGKIIRNKTYNSIECKAYREILCDVYEALQNKSLNINVFKTTMEQTPVGTDKSQEPSSSDDSSVSSGSTSEQENN